MEQPEPGTWAEACWLDEQQENDFDAERRAIMLENPIYNIARPRGAA